MKPRFVMPAFCALSFLALFSFAKGQAEWGAGILKIGGHPAVSNRYVREGRTIRFTVKLHGSRVRHASPDAVDLHASRECEYPG